MEYVLSGETWWWGITLFTEFDFDLATKCLYHVTCVRATSESRDCHGPVNFVVHHVLSLNVPPFNTRRLIVSLLPRYIQLLCICSVLLNDVELSVPYAT